MSSSFPLALFAPALLFLSACGPSSSSSATADDAVAAPSTHGDFMSATGTPAHPVRDIGFLVYDGVNDLDFMGPRYVLDTGRITTVMGVEITPTTTIAAVDSLDILVVPGGFEGTIRATYDEALHAWLRRVDSTTLYTAGVCTGGHILGAAGLLRGRAATTNWYRAEEKLAAYGARFTDDRFHRDGKYWTSAGVTAGMDMSLAMLADLWSLPYAQGVMLDMEYDPAPPFEGGSPERTPEVIFKGMEAMYDQGWAAAVEAIKGGE